MKNTLSTITALLYSAFSLMACASNPEKENPMNNENLELGQKDLADGIYAQMNTNKGTILLQLFFKETPLTVCNFVGLAEGNISNTAKAKGIPFYDGLKFHRVIAKFMIQGGDPLGNGSGDPGYKFEDEFIATLKHSTPGILSMANSGPGTNGSQFFITHVATPWLDGFHTIFGKVITGQDIVNAIQQDDSIINLKIIRQGTEAKAFKANDDQFKLLQSTAKERTMVAEAEANKLCSAGFDNWLQNNYPNAKRTASGLCYVIEKEGTGPQAVSGNTVSVHYAGKLENGTEFDNSYKREEPIEFKLGIGQVIPGWDEGIALMKVGAKYKLLIPSNLGYGKRGAGGVIPPNATLIFDTELLNIK